MNFSGHVEIQSILEGPPAEIATRLRTEKEGHAVAFTVLCDSAEEWKAFSLSLAACAQLLTETMLSNQRETIEQIVSLLVAKAPIQPTVLKEAQMVARARKAVLESGDWLSAAEASRLCGYSGKNLSAQPNKWKREGKIFAIQHHGNDYFPAYGLDPHQGYRPLKTMTDVLKVFGDTKDNWGLAYWFASVNSFLGGKRPQDLVATQSEQIIAAAKDEIQGIVHG
ncbi:hypothetical protein ID144_00630 [Pseudomonas sp. JM0905a]|uniref:hypothetical protein n=1 Tax=Pseudomonas sp. JM0905a TaxID=2772484 RepID=UPI001685866D|nr:hypothetical protein [Pseudomonas sp. JM0905a]MBD2835541.1 hypothetical protein [Pseudomonas sp. JM0905a]